MSEESVKRWLALLLLPALIAAAPAPLVVGSIRDQYGAAIAGARVFGASVSTRTDAQGTFALEAANVRRILITCRYCEPLTVRVTADQPVVAFVRRYAALAQQTPSQRDVASLPYARIESIAALRPFVVLENSSLPLPGARLSDRGASSRGMLVLDDGIPIYDVVSNQSPLVAFPAYEAQRLSWRSPADAFSYGDLAGGGTLLVDTHDDRTDSIAAAGSEKALRTGRGSGQHAWSLAASGDANDARASADATLRIPVGDDSLEVTSVASQDRANDLTRFVNTSVTGVRIGYERVRKNRLRVSLVADGGDYGGATLIGSYAARWSDVQAQAGFATQRRIQFFAEAGLRVSSGYDDPPVSREWQIAGNATQTHVDAGAQTRGRRYRARIGVSAYDLRDAGGVGGSHAALQGATVLPSFSGSYDISSQWTLALQAAGSFDLPTVLEAFASPPDGSGLTLDRNSVFVQTLRYGDRHRFRAAMTVLSEHVQGLDNGTIHSAGVSVAWQVAPRLSLRAWLLRENDQTQPYEPLYRFGAAPAAATVGSYWLTYEGRGVRVDAIYRRDLLDYHLDAHVDASISAPISRHLRLFAGTEKRNGIRYATIGIGTPLP